MEKTPKETCFFSTQICAQCTLKGGMSEKFSLALLKLIPSMEPGNSDDTYMTPMSGCILRNVFSIIDHGSELGYTGDWVQILEAFCKFWLPTLESGQQFLPWRYIAGPGSLGIFHLFICWYKCAYTLLLESLPYIFLRFLICQQSKGRWGVNRMPFLAWFTCPLHSEHCLFAFLPGVTPVLTGVPAHPGQLNSCISLSAAGTIQGTAAPDGFSQQNHQHRRRLFLLKFTGGLILTSVLYVRKHMEVTKVGVWCNWRENLLSRILFKSRCWKLTVSFCFVSPVSVYYSRWPKHWFSPL